eukprot:scaffold9300_cov59-Phaeocystis_antarctica.AAC.11
MGGKTERNCASGVAQEPKNAHTSSSAPGGYANQEHHKTTRTHTPHGERHVHTQNAMHHTAAPSLIHTNNRVQARGGRTPESARSVCTVM